MATKQYDFLGKRFIFGAVSLVVCAASAVLLFVPGPKYGIDFAGGTNIIARFAGDVDDAEVRSAVGEIGFPDAAVQSFGEGGNQFLIQTQAVTSINDERRAELEGALRATFGDDVVVEYDESSGDRVYVQVPEAAFVAAETEVEGLTDLDQVARHSVLGDAISEQVVAALDGADFIGTNVSMYGNPSQRRFQVGVQTLQAVVADGLTAHFGERFQSEDAETGVVTGGIDRVETVGPRVGQQRNDAINAILMALVGILLYIAVRFDLRYAPGAVLALAHDVLITLGIFVVLREEISLPILAALLTIVGYSLNDTIVNFDRVRENLQLAESRTDLLGIVNRSVNECLSRTVLTSVTTLIAVITIFVLGGGLIKSFALAMIIGVIVGTYSSIFVASPILVMMSNYMDARSRPDSAVSR